MRILYDYQAFSMQRFGGVSRYHRELFDRINAIEGDRADIAVAYADNEFLPTGVACHVSRAFHVYRGRGRGKLIAFANTGNKRATRKALLEKKPDVFHPTYYDPYFQRMLNATPYVITVHDMIHELFPGSVADPKTADLKRQTILGAEKIIAVSHSTKDDLLRLLPVDERKVAVIHHGATFTGEEPGDSDLPLPATFILYVGSRHSYKNFIGFICAIAPSLKKGPLALACAGGGGFTVEEKHLFERLGISDRIAWFPADDTSLVTLYKNALALAVPSRYEGFGLPVIEAMAFGCPSLLSDVSSLPEVGGDAAIYFDPDDPHSMLEAVGAILDPTRREALSCKARVRVQGFSWDTTVEEHLALYRSARTENR